jgi:hypothetical protein
MFAVSITSLWAIRFRFLPQVAAAAPGKERLPVVWFKVRSRSVAISVRLIVAAAIVASVPAVRLLMLAAPTDWIEAVPPVISDCGDADIARPASRFQPAGRASDPAIDAQIPFEAVAVMDVLASLLEHHYPSRR